MLIVSLLFTVLVCFCVPIVGMILVKKKLHGTWKLFMIGALAFFVSQICIRIPILTLVLPQFAWFSILQIYPWYYGLFLGATAALFEEGARWIAMSMMKRRGMLCASPHGTSATLKDGLSFGLGHGGIEAMLLVGINAIILLGMQAVGMSALLPGSAGPSFAAGIERFFTIAFHTGASLIVMYGVRNKKPGRYFTLAFILHTIMDAAVVIFPAIWGIGLVGMEIWVAIAGVLTLTLGIILCRREQSRYDRDNTAL